jgi:putative peptidoglycan lipid II flippase
MAIVNLTVNVVGNLVFMRWFGVSGIALSTSVVYMVSMSMILFLVARNLARMNAEKAPA